MSLTFCNSILLNTINLKYRRGQPAHFIRGEYVGGDRQICLSIKETRCLYNQTAAIDNKGEEHNISESWHFF